MFKKLLIANRGEIACRIMHTARELGIRTVAVYSEADENAKHVREADEAVYLGPPPALESYLNQNTLIAAVKSSGADAVHPGYGFFSENAAFAEAVNKAGAVFVGPPARAIDAMGAKDNAKAIMEKADVPVVPGYYGEQQDDETFAREAARIGYPVLLKAAFGGGGKGMRVVQSESELAEAAASAAREGESSFGNGRLLVEKYLTRTRHVEVQVFADQQGNAVYLFERDCSLQRRHQKVIEEAPAPNLSEDLRQRMGEAAVRAAKAVGYEGAGTVEFLLRPEGDFYFMEMNTRLQVEHPVTEMITGIDLVEWQLRVASGEELPVSQDDIRRSGHAMEVRLYAEEPAKGFMPSPGRIDHLIWPAGIPGMRIDTGVEEGDVISPFYDPMIAKLIVHAEEREPARRNMISALSNTEIVGPGVNVGFLNRLLDHEVFERADMDTGFIDSQPTAFFASPSTPASAIAAATLEIITQRKTGIQERATKSTDPNSPWNTSHCWRMNDNSHQDLVLRDCDEEETEHRVSVFSDGQVVTLEIDGKVLTSAELEEARRLKVRSIGGNRHVFGGKTPVELTLFDPIFSADQQDHPGNSFAAPMPGKIASIEVAPGQTVEQGDVLVVVEAMKMEHAIKAPVSATVDKVLCAVGDQVDEGQELIVMVE